jgi:RNA polymerase sigma-70 factor (ECF subfamily)
VRGVPRDEGVLVEAHRDFETLVAPLLDSLFATALRLTRIRADAEDVLQESVMKAWKSFDRFQKDTNFKAWVFQILKNTFISRKRSDKRNPPPVALADEGAVPSHPGEPAFDGVEWDRVYPALVDDDVKTALDELPDEYRLPLLLSSMGELSYKEMAAVLEVPIGTIMSRLFRGRTRLRETLRGYAEQRGIRVTDAPGAEEA